MLPLYTLNTGYELVDAQGYADELPENRTQIDALVEAAMKELPTRDYLQSLPPPKTTAIDTLLAARGAHMPDTAKEISLAPEVPSNSNISQELDLWETHRRQLQIALEMCNAERVNLELMLEYGATAWDVNAGCRQHLCSQVKRSLAEIQSDVDAVNKRRKMSQLDFSRKLRVVADEKGSLETQNAEVFSAIAGLEEQVRQRANAAVVL
ncbi:MAG: hypothetical protein KVP17_001274 [Porospora cf. gigantea B]|uniref:uncharacterized protein n=1 Tax=Porospora cf. gigantea B TaxID=2853592 RepID=UPI003571E3BC|nr:MAG: hypothetical protein KVP17_001274 [Porospora cf. gigantea B]